VEGALADFEMLLKDSGEVGIIPHTYKNPCLETGRAEVKTNN
jgi:hypothetical protein